MKRILSVGVLAIVAGTVVGVWQSPLVAQTTAKVAAQAENASYLIISPHTAEQCLAALDAVLAMPDGEKQLASWDWGCMAGDHTGYMMTTAGSPNDALKMVPQVVRPQAKAIQLNKFTSDQIKAFHAHTK